MLTVPVLLLSMACFLVLIPLHVGAVRWMVYQRKAFSQQGLLIGLFLALNIPLLAGVLALCGTESISDFFTAGAYAALVYNGVAYSYFHVFNMSETARRIKMIVALRQGAAGSHEGAGYEVADMIHARLERLLLMKHIACVDGSYILKNRFFVRVDALMRAWKSLLGIGC